MNYSQLIKQNLKTKFSFAGLLLSVITILLSSPAQAFQINLVRSTPFMPSPIKNNSIRNNSIVDISEVSESVINSALEQTSQLAGVPIEALKVIEARNIVLYSSCHKATRDGMSYGVRACLQSIEEGWALTVENGQKRWVYHGFENYKTDLEATYSWDYDPQENKWIYNLQNNSLFVGSNPIWWDFNADNNILTMPLPTKASLHYTLLSDSVFDNMNILSKQPNEDERLFNVIADNNPIGTFDNISVNFSKEKSIYQVIYDDFSKEGVKALMIDNINPSVDFQEYLPFDLGISPGVYKLKVEVIPKTKDLMKVPKEIPESRSILGSLALVSWAIFSRSQTQLRNK